MSRLKDAEKEAREAIRLGPDDGFSHYCLAHAYTMMQRYKLAEKSSLHAVKLNPWAAANFSQLGHIRLLQANWKGALEAATAGLELQADHVECANVRSVALRNMGRREEALQTIDTALSLEPDNAGTHANKGWALLEAGNHKAALEHFREALRLDPGNQWARQGVVSAIKARNPLYRIVFNYFVWMARLPQQARYAVIFGLWFIARIILPGILDHYPALKPIIWPIIVLYIAFCFSTWCADPLMNAMLRFDKFGKYALTRKQQVAANWTAGAFAVSLISFAAWLFHHTDGFLVVGIGFLFETCFVAAIGRASSKAAGVVLGVLTALVAIVIVAIAVASGFK